MIEIDKISKWYGSFQVLTDCTMSVRKGEVVVVCGPSGSGKSTLIKCVNALEPFQKGAITVDGTVVGGSKISMNALRARVGMVFQHFELFPHLSIEENLSIAQCKVLKRPPYVIGSGARLPEQLNRAVGSGLVELASVLGDLPGNP